MSSDNLRQGLISYLPNLRAFAMALCRDNDAADDLVQETLLKAWNGIDGFREGTNLRAWLFTIMRHTYFSEYRKRKREVVGEEDYTSTLSVPPEQQGHADARDLANALAQLSGEQREALILVAAEGFSYEEAAAISNCPVGTIKSRINRARSRLAKILGISSVDEIDHEPFRAVIFSTRGAAARPRRRPISSHPSRSSSSSERRFTALSCLRLFRAAAGFGARWRPEH